MQLGALELGVKQGCIERREAMAMLTRQQFDEYPNASAGSVRAARPEDHRAGGATRDMVQGIVGHSKQIADILDQQLVGQSSLDNNLYLC